MYVHQMTSTYNGQPKQKQTTSTLLIRFSASMKPNQGAMSSVWAQLWALYMWHLSLFITSDWLYGGNYVGIIQPHMVICGSFYHCASLTNHDMWRGVEGILEILPIPQVITELLKKWVNLLKEKSLDSQGQEKTNRSSNARSTGPRFYPLEFRPPPQTRWVWPYY